MRKTLKQEILQTALTLFNQNGYRATTMRNISEALGISLGNLTYHYHKKEDIMAALLQIPNFTHHAPAQTFEEFFEQIDAMLESLVVNRFFFSDDELGRVNNEFYLNNVHNVQVIGQLLLASLKRLADCQRLIPWRHEQECEAFCTMIMFAHITWIKETYALQNEHQLSKQEFLKTHWHLLAGHVSSQAADEYQKVYEQFCTA